MLFDRSPLLGLRFLILAILSVTLMLWDHHHAHSAFKIRNGLSIVTAPIVYAASTPFAVLENTIRNFQDRQQLVVDNNSLKAQVLILKGQVQTLVALQAENAHLRALLSSSSGVNRADMMLAQVMAIQSSPYQQEITLNKGSKNNVYIGQSVIDSHGILGQVIDVSPYSSRVLLLTDPQSGIPIQDNRTGLHGILTGQGNIGLLSWQNVQPSADIKMGDVLVSSGLGGHYPSGYPVGIVTNVNRHTNNQFLQIDVTPSAQMFSNEQVLLLWSEGKAS